MKRLFMILAAAASLQACSNNPWSEHESRLINESDEVMHVFTVEDEAEHQLLRARCEDFTPEMIASPTYAVLARKMVSTVTSPEQDGVGIAGPQVGLSRRVVAVMRRDKDGDPFEVYPNIRITAVHGDREVGPEGCLSVPGRRGEVARYRDIDITYTSPETLRDTTEHIQGFTAVIFQHECDHLDGVLYIDKLCTE